MSDEIEMEISRYEKVLQSIGQQLDSIAAETLRGAFLKQPTVYHNQELGKRHKKLTEMADAILDKIVQLQHAMSASKSGS